MATSALHASVAAIAVNRGGMVFSLELLRSAALDSLIKASRLGRLPNVAVHTGHPLVDGKFGALSVDPAQLQVTLDDAGGQIALQIGQGFNATVELFFRNDPTLVYSIISLAVPQLTVELRGDANQLHFDIADFQVTANVTPAPTRAAAIAASHIIPDDLLRIEGSLAYGTGARLMTNAIGRLAPIDLAELFPAFEFSGRLDTYKVTDNLLVLPEFFAYVGNKGCPLGDASVGIQIAPQVPTTQGDTRTWPIRATLPGPLNPPQVSTNDGIIGAYLPQAVLDVQFGKISPSLSYRDYDEGFIGYTVEFNTAIKRIQAAIDAANLSIDLSLFFQSDGDLRANIDVPCVGRQDLAEIRIELPERHGRSEVDVALTFRVDTAGRLVMVPVVTGIDLGSAAAHVTLFSKYLSFAGGEAMVIGFLLDGIIGRIIANNVPALVFDAIKDAVNSQFCVLANLEHLMKYLSRRPNRATYSADATSVLLGLNANEG